VCIGYNPISGLLATPVSPDWTVEVLAVHVLNTIAAQRSERAQEFILDAETTIDRQSRRVLRPLLACLATKSEAETRTTANLYGGRLLFKRPGPARPVWIVGKFQNGSEKIRVVFRCSFSPPQNSDLRTLQPLASTKAGLHPNASEAPASRPADEGPTQIRADG
jgi:hypothetical protein